ncbi:MAG: hypothetical protein ABIO92_10960 [Chloroflexia bacterium]
MERLTAKEMYRYPLPISRWFEAARNMGDEGGGAGRHEAVMRLADVITFYLGAVAVGQYSQALYTGRIEGDPTLGRSLRSLKRVLPGQWLLWAARGLEATPDGPVERLSAWYLDKQGGEIAHAYNALQKVMTEELGYTGEYGARGEVSPRALLEMVDQYKIIRGKRLEGRASFEHDGEVADALLSGLAALVASSDFFIEYELYAPRQRQLLMGAIATMPMPPMTAPGDAEASLLLYPPGEAPDYTKRPNLHNERAPLFPLDPLLVYGQCNACDTYRVGALRGVVDGVPSYIGLDPDCGHELLLTGP